MRTGVRKNNDDHGSRVGLGTTGSPRQCTTGTRFAHKGPWGPAGHGDQGRTGRRSEPRTVRGEWDHVSHGPGSGWGTGRTDTDVDPTGGGRRRREGHRESQVENGDGDKGLVERPRPNPREERVETRFTSGTFGGPPVQRGEPPFPTGCSRPGPETDDFLA